ncbi:MAG: hypothetical protein ISS69_17305 [Phycisphaerae bacterium]|nr:hypothetical protein [Phycisphaerae bacterium]
MLAIRTRYDGKEIRLPRDVKDMAPCEVIVLFEENSSPSDADWLRLQEESLAAVWDNKEDAVYDEV